VQQGHLDTESALAISKYIPAEKRTFLSREEIIDDRRQCLVDHSFHWHMRHTLDKYLISDDNL
jgi:hypothetical protein